MADNNLSTKSKESIGDSTNRAQVDSGLGRYFDNAVHTIFDEIADSEKTEASGASVTPQRLFDVRSTDASSNFLNDDTILNSDRVSDHGAANDSHRDAWIPSDRTKKVLRSIATSTPGSSFPDRENLTMPGLALREDMVDVTKETAIHFLGEDENIHRNVLTASDVTQDERGLRNLIQAGCYRAAVNLSGRLLAVYGQGYGKINHPSKHTPHSLQLWFVRFALLSKLKEVEVLETESKPFESLDKPDMYFTFYPELYGTRPGSMASFSFRLLLSEIPAYQGKGKLAIDNLYKILATVGRMIKNLKAGLGEDGGQVEFLPSEREEALGLWTGRRSRVLVSIVNCALLVKNYVLAVDILDDLRQSANWNEGQKEILNSAIGRIYLLLGDVSAAEAKFAIGCKALGNPTTVRELVDMGLMAVAQNAHQEAYNCFKKASTLDPSDVMLINNMAICLLYTGQLEAAVRLLESAVTRNPTKNLQEAMLLNICTLYELHTTHCKQLKLHLLRQLNRYKGDATAIKCLKLVV